MLGQAPDPNGASADRAHGALKTPGDKKRNLALSYGIIRIQKFGAGAVKGIEIHDQRKKDVSHTNPDIDRAKSIENYTLQESDSFVTGVKTRIKELNLKKAVRTDAVVMCQALITSDKDFFDRIPEAQAKQYFVDALKFVKSQYGAENIISATVHMDEKTPHMHVNFVPVTADGRLSAKNLITRTSLRQLQTDFFSVVGAKYNLKRGERREDKRKHLDTEEFKQEKRKAHINEISTSLDKKEIAINERKIEIDEEEKTVNAGIEWIKNVPPPRMEKIKAEDLKAVKSGNWLTGRIESSEGVAWRLNKEFIEPLQEYAKHAHELARRLNRAEEAIESHIEPLQKYTDLVKFLKPEQIQKLQNITDNLRLENDRERELERQRKNEKNINRGKGR